MRPIGGPRRDRNAIGRWQDRWNERLPAADGRARQASWTYIAVLVLACAVIAAVWVWSLGLGSRGNDGGSVLVPAIKRLSVAGADR